MAKVAVSRPAGAFVRVLQHCRDLCGIAVELGSIQSEDHLVGDGVVDCDLEGEYRSADEDLTSLVKQTLAIWDVGDLRSESVCAGL